MTPVRADPAGVFRDAIGRYAVPRITGELGQPG